jgi:hypothetical protein
MHLNAFNDVALTLVAVPTATTKHRGLWNQKRGMSIEPYREVGYPNRCLAGRLPKKKQFLTHQTYSANRTAMAGSR